MDTILKLLGDIIKSVLSTGSPSSGVIALLMLVIGYLMYDKKKTEDRNDALIDNLQKALNERNTNHTSVLIDVIDKYQAGQLSVVDAINEIKIILAKIDAKL